MKHSPSAFHALLLTLLVSSVVHAQAPSTPPASTPAASPTVLSEGYKKHVAIATAAATNGVARNFFNLCTIGATGGPRLAPSTVPFEPGKVFDNLYYVGLGSVSAWAVKTSDGIILIDALNNAKDAEETIAAGLKKLGLDPNQIKYVVITHGHGDHYGGAQYLADHFHARLISSDPDWKLMERLIDPNPNFSAPPKRDMTITDGEKLTLGDTTVTLYITPGHTPGTISVIIPLKENGVSHAAALWGGTAFTFAPTPENFKLYGQSADRFRDAARKAGADVILSNHGSVDDTPTKLPALKNRKPGEPNPFLVGIEGVSNALTVAGECARARADAL